jgi:Icc-related predicted phosphoesterase
MKLLVMSDIHGATEPLQQAAALIREADWVVLAGDITGDKTRAEAARVLACLEQHHDRILAVHGNWDRPEVNAYLEEKGYSLHGRGRILDGIGFFGLGGSSPTPMKTATEYAEETIAPLLRQGFADIVRASRRILVSHVPPRGVRDRSFLGLRGGSRSVRAFLEAEAVDLCLCGHIHEAAGMERFNAVIVANAGSFKRGRYLTVTIGERIQVTAGRIGR